MFYRKYMSRAAKLSDEEKYRRISVAIEIKEYRQQLHISFRQLSAFTGVSECTLRRLEGLKYIQNFNIVACSCQNALKIYDLTTNK